LAYIYPLSLAVISALVFVAERLWPWRPEQKPWRRALPSDLLHLVFNGHFLGLILFGIATHHVLPDLDGWLRSAERYDAIYRGAATSWPLWVQIPVALLVVDLLQWGVHNLLHRVPWLWETHKVHHSVVDGEMDWIVSFRFQWTEVVVYRALLYLPLAFFGFGPTAVLTHALFGTLIGHLNHANLDISWGPLKYVLNSPRMHLWHHDYDGDEKTTVNFGIIFSLWDWLFGTAKLPAHSPAKLGFRGVEGMPTGFFAQATWPLPRWLGARPLATSLATGAGIALAAGGLLVAQAKAHTHTPLLGEVAASSQPARARPFAYASSPDEASARLAHLGDEAKGAGFAHPEHLVSVDELAAALGSPQLVILDVRPAERFALGHIPSARRVYREDYSEEGAVPGLSRSQEELEALLRRAGVKHGDVVVLYGDNGPEPFRLWWTLLTGAGVHTRLLDGGLELWKSRGHAVAQGEGLVPARGDVVASGPRTPPQPRWDDLAAFLANSPRPFFLDGRDRETFTGDKTDKNAVRAGHIPGARHLEWHAVLDSEEDPRLLTPPRLSARLAEIGLAPGTRVLTYCQSGTRSAALYFALHQLGFAPDDVVNYDGSFSEYSRLAELPVELGPASSL
jgi:3-mercaptopyruvate sulfurtransferase SseA/sterol desaturase/sphingolipid hydroxylase (fatty acid hydroxylase superfamily)